MVGTFQNTTIVVAATNAIIVDFVERSTETGSYSKSVSTCIHQGTSQGVSQHATAASVVEQDNNSVLVQTTAA
jgi:hypothetical protein